ncbi:hypothetical protein FJ911_15450 [Lactiplantibacillus plantarum]|nr:hypothetical protein FJ911_15450 [Lactiplantibacillus plantarum]
MRLILLIFRKSDVRRLVTFHTILKEADLFCPNSVRINFTIYHCCLLNYCDLSSFRLSSGFIKSRLGRRN